LKASEEARFLRQYPWFGLFLLPVAHDLASDAPFFESLNPDIGVEIAFELCDELLGHVVNDFVHHMGAKTRKNPCFPEAVRQFPLARF